jgi:hypothetical protein
MPLRTVLILLALFLGCVAIVLLAWATGSEFYVFLPRRRIVAIQEPPTHPGIILALLSVCVALYLYSPRYALLFFTGILCCLLLGSLIGYIVFSWHPTLMQIVLTLMMIGEVSYGWSIQGCDLED